VRHGYQVLEAQDGPHAIQLFERHRRDIDLLLTDVVMPAMNGRELAACLWERRPDLKVIYMSGYTGDAMDGSGGLEAGAILIQKPFTPRTLLRRVREVLSGMRKNG
jgi:DNA-binding response OmpR family regulator